jgi:hypothetical protein
MPIRKSKQDKASPQEPEADFALPEAELQPAIPATAEAYAAARAALAAEMVGPLYGQQIDPEPDPVVELPPEPAPDFAPLPVPIAHVTPTPLDTVVLPAKEERKHRRALVLAAALFLISAVALSTELAPMVLRSKSDPVAAVDPSSSQGPTGNSSLAGSTLVTTPSATPTPTPTAKPTPKPTRKPTPRPVKKATPKPTPFITAVWSPNPPKIPNFIIKTKPGAVCTITRTRIGVTPTSAPRVSPQLNAPDGVATWNYGQATARTYTYKGTCTLSGHTASTSTVTIKT